ncbi:MAG TPA: serine--tRNA ligase [Gemmatimonadales bacterium]|jgi:seryl-tRNA synthetase
MIDARVFKDADAYAAARQGLTRRGDAALGALLDELRAEDEKRRRAIAEGEALKAEQNTKSKLVAETKKKGGDASALLAELGDLSRRASERQSAADAADAAFRARLLNVPNTPAPDVQAGDASHNTVVRNWGDVPAAAEWRKPHWDLAKELGILDFERAAKLAGAGFPLYVGLGARLERALITYLLQLQAQTHGYTEIAPPFVVNRATMTGTGQLPKFEDDLYRTSTDDLFLIPTAEVPVTNLHRDEILAASDLPRRYTAYTPCWRREAGAAGADTRGILRVHQFDKVEIVWFTEPSKSDEALEQLTSHAEMALQNLGLPYRVLKLATGDLGFANYRTYDLETWAPGVGKWLEVSSCSSYGDFQARRMNIRYRAAAGAKPEFVHTLNGSALGLARTFIAVLENYQEPDGSIRIPDVLVPLMGVDRIGPGRA